METRGELQREPTPDVPSSTPLTDREVALTHAIRRFNLGYTDTLQLADALEMSPEALEQELAQLQEKSCIKKILQPDQSPSRWRLRVKNSAELERLQKENNPEGKPVGHYTGRCMDCASDKLWDDDSIYGCDCCGGMFHVGNSPPKIIENRTGQDLGPTW
jgi:hypothetical protein